MTVRPRHIVALLLMMFALLGLWVVADKALTYYFST